MKTIDYSIQKKNATAVCTLRSWLTAVGVENKPSAFPGSDITITGKEKELEIAVVLGAQQAPAGVMAVNGKEIIHKNKSVAIKAFQSVTEAAGYGSPVPVCRGEEPNRKMHYNDEFDLVAMRHREFRRSVNPDAEKIAHYKPVLDMTCWAFLRSNLDRCSRFGFSIDDLMQYAQTWLVNYISRCEVSNPLRDDNERRLTSYLRQRFAELAKLMDNKSRNCLPDEDAFAICVFGDAGATPMWQNGVGKARTATYVTHHPYENPDEDAVDVDYVQRNCKLDIKNPTVRKESASKLLAQLLGELPHDERLETLRRAGKNRYLHPDAQREARKQLAAHKETCSHCLAADVNQNVAGTETRSAAV